MFNTLSHELAHDAWNYLSDDEKSSFRAELQGILRQYHAIKNVSNEAIKAQGLTPPSFSAISYWLKHENDYKKICSDPLRDEKGNVNQEQLEMLMKEQYAGTEAFAFLGEFEVTHRGCKTPGYGIPEKLLPYYSEFFRCIPSSQ